jgi:hypothetical protein
MSFQDLLSVILPNVSVTRGISYVTGQYIYLQVSCDCCFGKTIFYSNPYSHVVPSLHLGLIYSKSFLKILFPVFSIVNVLPLKEELKIVF